MSFTKVSTLLEFALDSPIGWPAAPAARLFGPTQPGRYDTQGNFDGFFTRNHQRYRMRSAFLFAGFWTLIASGFAPGAEAYSSPRTVPFETHTRVPWKTSRVYGRPDPPLPYRLSRVFEKITLKQPLFLAHEPTTGDLMVAQLQGPILIFANRPDVDHTDTFLDVGEDTYSFAFDPHYADNRYVYVFSNGPRDGQQKRNRIARYQVAREQPPRCEPDTRHVILDYESNGHNGGDLAFGPDEMLYITAGDGTSDSDTNLTGQNLADLPSAILRIDVRGSTEGEPHKIPPDNPFVATPGARGEIWAYGLRNPWRMSFDCETGALLVGDVGQDWVEMIYLIERGGNYGWSVEEGGQPFHPLRERGPTAIVPPLMAHSHSEARSITGGHVYYGKRFAEVRGTYIYGDFATGKFWGLRYDGQRVTCARNWPTRRCRWLASARTPRASCTSSTLPAVSINSRQMTSTTIQPHFRGD